MSIQPLVDAGRNWRPWLDWRQIKGYFQSVRVSLMINGRITSAIGIPVTGDVGASVEPRNLFFGLQSACTMAGLCEERSGKLQ